MANGLHDNGNDVTIVAEEGVRNFKMRIYDDIKLHCLPPLKFSSHFRFLFNRTRIKDCDIFLYRKTIFSLLWIILFRILFLNRKFKIVSEVNGFVFDYSQKFKSKTWLHDFTVLLHKLVLRFDDLIYVVNEDLSDKLTSGVFPVRKDKVIAIHNGGPKSFPIQIENADVSIFNLVFFGILADYNELDLCIEAISSYRDKNIHIIGFGDQLQSLKEEAVNMDNVFFYGAKTFEQFGQLLNSLNGITAGVIPMNLGNSKSSLSPIKAFDYMSFGLPIIFSNICLEGVINPGVEGESYKVGDLNSLRNSIKKVSDPPHYMKLRSNVLQNYHNHTWTARMSVLDKALKLCVG